MNDVVKACVIMHNMIVEERYVPGEEGFGTKNICTVDPNAALIPLRVLQRPQTEVEAQYRWRLNADLVENHADHVMLQNALQDDMWAKFGGRNNEI